MCYFYSNCQRTHNFSVRHLLLTVPTVLCVALAIFVKPRAQRFSVLELPQLSKPSVSPQNAGWLLSQSVCVHPVLGRRVYCHCRTRGRAVNEQRNEHVHVKMRRVLNSNNDEQEQKTVQLRPFQE